jgi:UDP-glucose 4-epimerase
VLTRSPPTAEVTRCVRSENLLVGDACDPKLVRDVVATVDHIVVCGGGLMPAASERQPEVDAALALELLDNVTGAALGRNKLRLLFMSSGGTVYGQPRRLPVDEEHPTLPLGAYGRARVACERLLKRRRAGDGVLTCSLRCANAYGEFQLPDRGQGAVATFLEHVRTATAIEMYGDGSVIRDYVYAPDIARAVVVLLGHDLLPEVINVGSGRGTSLVELVDLIAREVGREAEIVRRADRPFDVPEIVLNVELLTRIVALPPTQLELGLARTHRWLATNPLVELMGRAKPVGQEA